MDTYALFGRKNISLADQQKISQKLVSLAMDVLLDVAVNNLQSDEDLASWLELTDKIEPDSNEPVDFLKEKISDFDKVYHDVLKKELTAIKK